MRATRHEPPIGSGEPEPEFEKERKVQKPNDTETGDAVSRASEDSFPASDAPPWTTGATRGAPEPDAATWDDEVTRASEDSFPASDAPPWTSSTS